MNWLSCVFLEELDPSFENLTHCVGDVINIQVGDFELVSII